ncbi:Proline--tRNA ligase [Tetrabaena socialis]|uniref:Proline--tRNA ligase n=1 Tax=Tetrabaena socialis TaxID=47790 RepID=A0A2J8AEK5_9CHLO|nr:Proline--tRNA ligase [Tetrabaena socialis]|eukprot:PNH10955.1 Proline--tRNA ligase [Tetrabaena socialis]
MPPVADAPPGAPSRSLGFRAGSGDTVRVVDVVCWRFLDGRPCLAPSEQRSAAAVDVIIIPVLPTGHGRNKRAQAAALSGPTSGAGEGSNSTDGGQVGGGDAAAAAAVAAAAVAAGRDVLLRACRRAQAALAAVGLRPVVDDCPRQTPGAKYNLWENRGVALRVEVGAREVASGTACLALHPRCAHLMQAAAQAAAQAEAEAGGCAAGAQAGAAAAAAAATAKGGGAARPPSLRLPGLGMGALAAACAAVCAAAAAAEDAPAPAPAPSPGPGDAAAPPAAAGAAHGGAVGPGTVAGGSGEWPGWCGKLHLWPSQVAASDTASAVEALLAVLRAAAEAGAAGSPPLPSGLPLAPDQPPSGAAGAGCRQATGDTAAVVSGWAAEAGGAAAPSQRPCVPHLKHLLQLGQPCYCGRGHHSMQQLQAEVEQRYEQRTGRRVEAWVAPPPPPPWAGRQGARRQQQQQQQRRRGAAEACSGADEVAADAAAGMAGIGRSMGEGAGDGNEDAGGGVDDAAGDGSEEGDEEEGGGSGDGGEGDGDAGGERVVLVVGSINPGVRAAAVQKELAWAFAPYGCQAVTVSRTRNGGNHGWARVALVGPGAVAAAAAAVRDLDGRLRLGGSSLSVSPSAGRLDTIFPFLPYAVRSVLRVDGTAAFSATDQATADKMSALLAALAEAFLVGRPLVPPPGEEAGTTAEVEAEAEAGAGAEEEAEAGEGAAGPAGAGAAGLMGSAGPKLATPHAAQEPGSGAPRLPLTAGDGQDGGALRVPLPPPRPRSLPLRLPLSVTDGTACCGGNSLSLARRFERVTAVELDTDRAADLRHNVALVRAWATFQRERQQQGQQQQQQEQQQPPACARPRPRGDTRDDVVTPSGAARDGAGCSARAHLSAAEVAHGGGDSGTSSGGGGGDGGASSAPGGPGAAAAAATPAADAANSPLGELVVVCGDYARLGPGLAQDILFLDPPWGGPQYSAVHASSATAAGTADEEEEEEEAGAAAGAAGAQQQPGGGAAAAAAAGALPHALPAHAALPCKYGDVAFSLGGVPLSRLVSEQLAEGSGGGGGSGGAGMVALKLPSRADAELRAMQARVRQLLGARWAALLPPPQPPALEGGPLAGTAGSGPRCGCGPRLLCAEVRFGRSALVVFLRAPPRGGCWAPAGSDGCGGGDGSRALQAEYHKPACAAAVPGDRGAGQGPAGAGGMGGASASAPAPAPATGGAGGAARAAADRAVEPGNGVESDESGDGDNCDHSNEGSEEEEEEGEERTARRRGAVAGGCRLCAGVGLVFRSVLRRSCAELGLPYRVVFD